MRDRISSEARRKGFPRMLPGYERIVEERINYRIMKLNMMERKSPLFEEKQIYYKKILDKCAGH